MSNAYLDLDATAQAAAVRSGEVRAIDLVEAAIARIEARDGPVNAVIATAYDAARAQAERPLSAEAPFAGVPFLIKDLNLWSGTPTTLGCRQFRGYRLRRSEASVDAALATGVIPLGRTNSSEFGLLGTTEPLLHGPTRNPWDLSRSVGGSSGGSAAAVAAGYVPFAFSGDGGGSIRIPASACGVFGFKPSFGRCPPPKRKIPGNLSVHFSITRSVRDAARMLAATELEQPIGDLPRTGFVAGPSRRRLRIGVLRETVLGAGPDPEVAAALAQAETLCRDLGHEMIAVSPVLSGEEAVRRFLTYWSWIPWMLEQRIWLLRLATRRYLPLEEAFEPWTRGLAAWHRRERAKEPDFMLAADAFFARARAALFALHRDVDVVLSPVTRTPAPEIGAQAPTAPFDILFERSVDYVGYTPVQNATGAPAMSVPLGQTADGRPIGLQFAAAPGEDGMLMALAYQLEDAAPWAGRRPVWPFAAGRAAAAQDAAI